MLLLSQLMTSVLRLGMTIQMLKMLGLLYKSFGVGKYIYHLVIAGDGVSIKLLSEITFKYGDSLG